MPALNGWRGRAALAAATVALAAGVWLSSDPVESGFDKAPAPAPAPVAAVEGGLSDRQLAAVEASTPRTTESVDNPHPRYVPEPGGPPGVPIKETFPARMLPPRSLGFYDSSILWPMRNGWQVSNHTTFTAVYAGGGGLSNADKSSGRLLIYRQNYLKISEDTTIVDVPNSGPVKLTSAPLGNDAGTWAQEEGQLRFSGADGVTGILDLSDDSVTITGRG